MKKRILTGALIAGALMFGAGAAAPAMAADNLIVNGGFSEPVGTVTSSYLTGPFPGWSISDPNGFHGDSPLTVKRVNGAQSAQITGTLAQDFPTEVGKTYTGSFAMFAGLVEILDPPIPGVAMTVTVSSGAQVLVQQDLVSPANGTAPTQTFSFTATGTTTKLSFTVPNQVVGVDVVSVTEVPENDSPIMIPAIAGGLGIAALGASGIAIQRKKKLAGK